MMHVAETEIEEVQSVKRIPDSDIRAWSLGDKYVPVKKSTLDWSQTTSKLYETKKNNKLF